MASVVLLHRPCHVIVILLLLVHSAVGREEADGSSGCSDKGGSCHDGPAALRLKLIAITAILVASALGICLPLFARSVPALGPEKSLFSVVKAFASGVILATGYMHVLPDAVESLTSPCLPESPWQKFPFAMFVAMLSAVATLAVDSLSMSYYRKKLDEAEEAARQKGSDLLRYRVVAQVLEVGIVVHSVVIGLSLGASDNPCTIRPLIAALCFHQLFEGMGLGGCILQAEYQTKMKAIMVFFFSFTTPFGIALGIGLSKVYSDNSPTGLIVVGLLDACSAGLLNYMALVELLGSDFLGPKLQANVKLQIVCYASLLLGAGGMSLMAKWA